MTCVPQFIPEEDHARWASNMKRSLDFDPPLCQADVAWLVSVSETKPGEHSVVFMCDLIIKRWTVMQVTARLKS